MNTTIEVTKKVTTLINILIRHVGVVNLPASIIDVTPHRITDGVQNALLRTPRSPIEITRILLKEGWENGAGEKRGRKRSRHALHCLNRRSPRSNPESH